MRQQLTIVIGAVLVATVITPGVAAAGPAADGVAAAESTSSVVAAAGTASASAASAAQPTCAYPLERTDARGETVSLEEEPESVVALYPGDAQLAAQIGAGDRIVGMPIGQYTDDVDPGDATDVSRDDGVTPVAEEVIALDPDVVIAGNIALGEEDLLDQLESAGLTVYVHDRATSIDGVRENVEVTGELTGECEGATERVDWMDERLAVVDDALSDVEAPLAYYPNDDQGTTPGTETFQHDVLTTAGLENVAERADIEDWREISAEVVVSEDPEWIVYPDWREQPPIDDGLEGTTAAREGNVLAVDDDAMSQPAPGVVRVVEQLVAEVHPDVYADVEADLAAIDDEYGVEDSFAGERLVTDEGDAVADGGVDDESETNDGGAAGSEDGAAGSDGGDGETPDEGSADGDSGAESGSDDGASSIPGFGAAAALAALATVVARRFP